MKTKRIPNWGLRDQIRVRVVDMTYELVYGIHTYHLCKCKRNATRAGVCWQCLAEEIAELVRPTPTVKPKRVSTTDRRVKW